MATKRPGGKAIQARQAPL